MVSDAKPPIDARVLADVLKDRPADALLPDDIAACAWRLLEAIGKLLKVASAARVGLISVERQRVELIPAIENAELAARRFSRSVREAANAT